jgi:hypothetical protein
MEWQYAKRRPIPPQNEKILFIGVSFKQLRIAFLEPPKLVERALNQEIKKLLRGFEKRNEKGSSAKKTKRKHKKAAKTPVSLGGVIKENLPYPVVYYPNHYGTFFGFAKDESSQVALCLCSKPAIENLIRLKRENPSPYNINPSRRDFFDGWFVPEIIASIPINSKRDPLEDLCFVEGLCHRCNLITPRLRYCHEMYGGECYYAFLRQQR